jgi:hypothetical protein
LPRRKCFGFSSPPIKQTLILPHPLWQTFFKIKNLSKIY